MTQNTTEHVRILYVRAGILLLFWCVAGWSVVYAYTARARVTCDVRQLCVAFLDVGQGDAIYIRSPSGKSLLVDGGRDGSVLRELAGVMPQSSRTITYVVATHPDLDHIGGLAAVVDRYDPEKLFTIESEKETSATRNVSEQIIDKNVNRVVAYSGEVLDLGDGVTATVLYPFHDIVTEDANEESIMLLVKYDESSFLLTGDAPIAAEHALVHRYGDALQADVLKLGHHGSKTSSSGYFLETAAPTYAIISAGKDNSYGHPHEEVLKRLAGLSIPALATAQNGTIILETDGQKITARSVP